MLYPAELRNHLGLMLLALICAKMRGGSGCSTLFLTVERSILLADSSVSLQPAKASAIKET